VVRVREWDIARRQIRDLAEYTSYLGVSGQASAPVAGLAACSREGIVAAQVERLREGELESAIQVWRSGNRWQLLHGWRVGTVRFIFGWSPRSEAVLYQSFAFRDAEGKASTRLDSSLHVASLGDQGEGAAADVLLAGTGSSVAAAAWAADGKQIYCVTSPHSFGWTGDARLMAIAWPSAKTKVLHRAEDIGGLSVAEQSGDVVWCTPSDRPAGGLIVWRLAPGGEPVETPAVLPAGASLLVVAPDGNRLVAVFSSHDVSVYDLRDGRHVAVSQLSGATVRQVVWAKAGAALVAALGDGDVRLVPVPPPAPTAPQGRDPSAAPGGSQLR
jgi:hypothetical protein